MRAVVMCGGRGERLRPLTDTVPKPLLPVAGRPVLDRLLEKLAEAGLEDVTLAVGYLGPMIEDYCTDGVRWGLHIDYVRQAQPMGTIGAVWLMRPMHMGEPKDLLIINGDKVFERASDLRAVMDEAAHARDPIVATYPFTLDRGIVECSKLVERPTLQGVAGLYWIPGSYRWRIKDVMDMPELLSGYVTRLPLRGYVLDIGTPATYEAACARLS